MTSENNETEFDDDNFNDLMKKNIDKIISYYQRNIKIENEIPSEVIQIIYYYQKMIDFYQLSIPVTHSCVQSFGLNFNNNKILIQAACLFFIFNTKTFKYTAIARLFENMQRLYNYHFIHIANKNKLYMLHGKNSVMTVQELIIDNEDKQSFFSMGSSSSSPKRVNVNSMFGMRSVVLNDEYFVVLYDDFNCVLYNYLTNDMLICVLNLPNKNKLKSCGVVALQNNELLIFTNNRMYNVKFSFFNVDEMVIPEFDIKMVDNELFKDDFILHEFGYVLCDEYILIFGGNYNDDYDNPIFSDDIYIYNINYNKWYKSKIKIPFMFNVKNNNLLFDPHQRMIHLIGANEFVDKRYDEPNDISPSSRCHLIFDLDVLIHPQNIKPYIYENKQSLKTDYSRCIIIYMD